jgi:hypothetical protein
LLNIVDENGFLNKTKKIILVPSSYFPLYSHYPSLLNDIQFEILILGQQMKIDVNKF